MTIDELRSVIHQLESSFSVLKQLLAGEPVLKHWMQKLRPFAESDATFAFCQWVDHNNRAPTLEDFLTLCEEGKHQRVTGAQRQADTKAFGMLTLPPDTAADEFVPHNDWSAEANDAWVRFHLEWIQKGLNQTLVQASERKKKQFPWQEWYAGYQQLAEQYPEVKPYIPRLSPEQHERAPL